MSSDRIEKEVLLRAPLARVCRAISDADDEVAQAQEPYAGKADTWQIVAVEPQLRRCAEHRRVAVGRAEHRDQALARVELDVADADVIDRGAAIGDLNRRVVAEQLLGRGPR